MAVCGAPQPLRQHLLPPGMREHAAVLEDEQRLADRQRAEGHSSSLRSNVISVEPIVTTSPLSSLARAVRWPLTAVPFVESRSISQ